MDRKLGINEEGEPLSNVDVLSTVISQCEANMVLLTEMPPPKQVVDDQILICTYEFELTGEFKNLLQFLFAIESKKGFAKLVSVDFYVDRKDLDEVQLFCRAYMQTYIINKDGYEL
ncbi:MAG: hypothetical protein PHQ65_08425 [Bacteroidales bacterium]|nr:hypothetical protein [Bacteroidales bacterium]